MLIVQACSFLRDGDGYYRETMPARHLAQLPGVTFVDCHVQHRMFSRLAELADVLILFFVHDWDLLTLYERRRSQGKITVFETNDLYEDLPPWSLIWKHWLDPDIDTEHWLHIEFADAIQTSTNELALRRGKKARKAAVFPNQLETVPSLEARKVNENIHLGWAGSQGHLGDFTDLAKTLEPWLRKHPDILCSVMSGVQAFQSMDLPAEQYRYKDPGSIEDYNAFLHTLDIGIAPVLPTDYNACRSDVKFLEYAAHGVVGIYASPGPYDDTVVHGETGFLYKNPKECIKYLELLIGDSALRAQIQKNAWEYVKNERKIEDHVASRLEFYRNLFPNEVSDTVLPDAVGPLASQDGNYYKLELDALSLQFSTLLEHPPSPENFNQLVQIVAQDPGWTTALKILGKLANDLGRPQDALALLNHARAQEPNSARILAETARAHLLLKDIDNVRQHIDAALSANKHYFPAWTYLLRFMKLVPQPDQSTILAKLEEVFPNSYQLRVLVADLLSPEEACGYLQKTIRSLAKSLNQDRLFHAGKMFHRIIGKVVAAAKGTKLALELAETASRTWPHSARLANLAGQTCISQGKRTEGEAHYRRALEIRKVWDYYRSEFHENDDLYNVWKTPDFIEQYGRRR